MSTLISVALGHHGSSDFRPRVKGHGSLLKSYLCQSKCEWKLSLRLILPPAVQRTNCSSRLK